jgi:Fur family ferric uptake transcriptional regulator
MMSGAQRGRYSTKQQAAVLSLMRKYSGESLTVDEVHDSLDHEGIHVGTTTIYRSLERLSSEGHVVQVPDPGSKSSRWCFVEAQDGGVCLACLSCHRVFTLACEGLEAFVRHVSADHSFEVETQHTVLYGYCADCLSKRQGHRLQQAL